MLLLVLDLMQVMVLNACFGFGVPGFCVGSDAVVFIYGGFRGRSCLFLGFVGVWDVFLMCSIFMLFGVFCVLWNFGSFALVLTICGRCLGYCYGLIVCLMGLL